MSEWTKNVDWIPYTNAVNQVIYYLKTIKSSERSLAIMDMMGVSPNDNGYKQTIKEIGYKQELLEIAIFKVKRSFKRITETDKINWSDKVDF